VTMKNAVFLDFSPCGSCKNRHYGRTSVLTRTTRRNVPEDDILQGKVYRRVRRVLGEGIFCALIRTVCTDLRDLPDVNKISMWWVITGSDASSGY
jgi:hypothetical protein